LEREVMVMRKAMLSYVLLSLVLLLLFPAVVRAESTSEKARKTSDDLKKRYDALVSNFENATDKDILKELKELKSDVLEFERDVEKVGFAPSRKNCGLRKVNERKEAILKQTDEAQRIFDGAITFEEDVFDGKTIGGRPITREDVKDKVTPLKEPIYAMNSHCIVMENEIKHHKDELRELQKEWKERLDIEKEAEKTCAAYEKNLRDREKMAKDQKEKYESLRSSKGPTHKDTIAAQNTHHRTLGEVENCRKAWEQQKEKVKRIEAGNKKFLTDELKKETESSELPEKQIEAWEEE